MKSACVHLWTFLYEYDSLCMGICTHIHGMGVCVCTHIHGMDVCVCTHIHGMVYVYVHIYVVWVYVQVYQKASSSIGKRTHLL